MWEALKIPLSYVGGGIMLALIFNGFPTFITVNKNYYNTKDKKDEGDDD